uniref:Fork-head domain-containing protein n=1 Tax=Steinernema glaseri TaxID=37863 RepID=A0A1I8ADD0_9BILA
MAPKKQHQQNQYGLSYSAMVILVIQNAPVLLKGLPLCNRGTSVKDIYTYLKAHVKPLAQMGQKEWEKTERVIRHTLSQTTYFHRFSTDEDGRPVLVASKEDGGLKGSLWTLHPAPGESVDK